MDKLDDQVFQINSNISYLNCKSGDPSGILGYKRMVGGEPVTRYIRWGPGLQYETELQALAYLEDQARKYD